MKTGAGRNTGGSRSGEDSRPTGRVERPDDRFTTYTEGDLFRVSVPSNWREVQDTNSVTFAPEGAVGSYNGQSVFTHGMEFGVARNESHDLQTATEELVDSLASGNPGLKRSSGYERVNVADRRGLRALLTNRSEATGQDETIEVFTTQLQDGTLLYAIGVAPQNEFRDYRGVFDRVISSIRVEGE